MGYLSLLPLRTQLNLPFLCIIPVCVSLGFVLHYLWVLALSSFTLHPLPLFSLFFISVAIIFYQRLRVRFTNDHSVKQRYYHTQDKLISIGIDKGHWKYLIVLFIIPSILFLSLITYYQQPILYSDLGHHHTWLTESIISKGHLDPFWEAGEIIGYPIGWHVLTGSFSILFNLEPLKMGFVLIGITSFLIYGVLLSISYFLTRSLWLSAASMAAFFYSPLTMDTQTYLYGLFVYGIAPVQLSFLCILLGLSLLLLIKRKNNQSFLSILLLLLIGAGIAYPPMVFYFLIWIALYLIVKGRGKKYNLKIGEKLNFNIKSLNISHLVLISLIIGMTAGSLLIIQYNIVFYDLNTLNDFSEEAKLKLSGGLTYLTDDYVKYLVILVIISMINLFYFKEIRYFTIVVFSSIMIGIMAPYFGYFEGFFVPLRINSLLVPFTWILLGCTIRQIESVIYRRLAIKSKLIITNEEKLQLRKYSLGKNFLTILVQVKSGIYMQKLFSFIVKYHLTIIFIGITILIFSSHLENVMNIIDGELYKLY